MSVVLVVVDDEAPVADEGIVDPLPVSAEVDWGCWVFTAGALLLFCAE
jgi:hypothetical protein